MAKRFIARPAPWWEVIEITPEGKRVVVATAATQKDALAEICRRTERNVAGDPDGGRDSTADQGRSAG